MVPITPARLRHGVGIETNCCSRPTSADGRPIECAFEIRFHAQQMIDVVRIGDGHCHHTNGGAVWVSAAYRHYLICGPRCPARLATLPPVAKFLPSGSGGKARWSPSKYIVRIRPC